ncbi:BF2992 family fimbrillin-A clan protein [Ligilactobacillus acidipiscis]|uniref:Phage protein n=1 Tax=Ligilactobacillus acidipiscis TaxID=89059 RepID=A0A0R2KFZ3_9LACO|nr:BF2992 family fimbrillin-A clan protein [Ligilactobacillus acidipiscis]KRN88203.1 phage protein [Ligilactobacillus acidipiscis]
MGYSQFKFNGHKSSDFNMYINSDYELASTTPDYQAVEIPGRDGDLLIPNNRFKSFKQDFPITYIGSYDDSIKKIEAAKQLMLQDTNWHDMSFSFDPDFIYCASFVGEFRVKKSAAYLTQTLSFNVMPYKYLTTGQTYQTITDGYELNNLGTILAKPIIKITGKGDCTIKIGNRSVSLKGIDGGIVMDSDSQLCTNLAGTRTQFDKMYGDFIDIAMGKQTVKITGDNITKAELLPRWAVRC